MCRIYSYQELQEKVIDIDKDELYKKICRNIKRIRNERYIQYKNSGCTNEINPYTTENISALLNYNHNHYKRFESENDSTKKMPLIKLMLLAIIFDTTLDELVK